jgi:hypothetical protein
MGLSSVAALRPRVHVLASAVLEHLRRPFNFRNSVWQTMSGLSVVLLLH